MNTIDRRAVLARVRATAVELSRRRIEAEARHQDELGRRDAVVERRAGSWAYADAQRYVNEAAHALEVARANEATAQLALLELVESSIRGSFTDSESAKHPLQRLGVA